MRLRRRRALTFGRRVRANAAGKVAHFLLLRGLLYLITRPNYALAAPRKRLLHYIQVN